MRGEVGEERSVVSSFQMVDRQLAPLEILEPLPVPLDGMNHDRAGSARGIPQGAHGFEHVFHAGVVVGVSRFEEGVDHIHQDERGLVRFGHHDLPLARERRIVIAITVKTTMTMA